MPHCNYVQKGFLNEHSRSALPDIVQLIDSSEHVLFTRFINTPKRYFEKQLEWSRMMSRPEIDLADELFGRANEDLIYDKGNYSAFINEELGRHSQSLDIKTIELCGFDTDACVMATALEGVQQSFEILIHLNACASSGGMEFHEMATKILKRNLGAKSLLNEMS